MQIIYAIDTEDLQRQTNTVNTKDLPKFKQVFTWKALETATGLIPIKPVAKIIHQELFIINILEDIFLDKKEKTFVLLENVQTLEHEIYFVMNN